MELAPDIYDTEESDANSPLMSPPPPPPPSPPPPSPPPPPPAHQPGPPFSFDSFESRLREEGFSLVFNEDAKKFYYLDRVSGERFWADEVELEPPGSPASSKASSKASSVLERSAQMLEQKERKVAALRQAKEEAELRTIQPHPLLTKRSEGMSRSVEDMLAWEEQRRERLAAKAKAIAEQESAAVTGCPTITRKARMLRSAQEDDGSVSTATKSVQERLYDYEDVRRSRLQRLHELQDQAIREAAIPKIDEHSARLVRRQQEGSVHQRLYVLARQQSNGGTAAAGGRLLQHDEQTGQRLFAPKINRTSEALARKARGAAPVEDILHEKGMIYRHKLQVRERMRSEFEARARERPKISTKSERIVNERQFSLGESTKDRLHRPIGKVRERTLNDMEQPTFQPRISAVSQELVANRFGAQRSEPAHLSERCNVFFCDGQEFSLDKSREEAFTGVGIYDRAKRWDKERQARLARESQERERREMEECSFHPNVQTNRTQLPEQIGGVASIAERHAKWALTREERLEQQRRWREEEEFRDCTFTPQLDSSTHRNKQSGVSTSTLASRVSIDAQLSEPEPELPALAPPVAYTLPTADFYFSDFGDLERIAYARYSAYPNIQHAAAPPMAARQPPPAHPPRWFPDAGPQQQYSYPGMGEQLDDDFSMSAAVELE